MFYGYYYITFNFNISMINFIKNIIMDKNSKELLLQDICSRLLYGVKCDIGDNKPYTLSSISNDYDGILIIFKEKKNGFNMEVYITEVKPYLFPLSSMTDEQHDELHYILDTSVGFHKYDNAFLDKDGYSEVSMFNILKAIEWLNKNHFDYRGLIEKGLAIDATNLNIY